MSHQQQEPRQTKANKGGDEMTVGGPNPRANNRYGQIVRWRPDGGDHTAAGFAWDLYVVAGNPTVHQDERAGSKNINADNMFNSPDGLAFDSRGGLWIQTDGSFSNEGDFAGQGNNQMLLGNTETGEISRFLVGPNACEVTGITWSADRKTMFVGIQHPGGKPEVALARWRRQCCALRYRCSAARRRRRDGLTECTWRGRSGCATSICRLLRFNSC